MKTLGVKFENFACFDECYLPLEPGIRILAGRNNSGKTALLRGLTALNSLPLEPGTEALDIGLAKYCRGNSPPSFDLHVLFEPHEEDYPLLGQNLDRRPGFQMAAKILDFHFRAFPLESAVGFCGSKLSYDGQEIEILRKVANSMIHAAFGGSGLPLGGGNHLPTTGPRSVGGTDWPLFSSTGLLSKLTPLRNVLLVDAHRVVIPEHILQVVEELPQNAASLAPFLDTLHGNNRPVFEQIENFVTRVFPEFRYVNPEKRANSVTLTLTRQADGAKIPLSHCGTGVEQVLALATFVLTAEHGSLILLDEPHSYLHPTAEHDVISFLKFHREHSYFISSHSAILINAVTADRVISLTGPVLKQVNHDGPTELTSVLHSLGYKNSDFLFADRLVFVEGESDQEILPLLLSRDVRFQQHDIDRTGFPTMGGEGKLRGATKQTSMIHFEKMIEQLGKVHLPRMYLFDGDCEQDDAKVLQETPYLKDSRPAKVKFLRRREIENYLLVPEAIQAAIKQLLVVGGDTRPVPDKTQIESDIAEVTSASGGKLYPGGKTDPLEHALKGSVALELIFEKYGIPYNKRTSGRLVAQYVTAANQRALSEIWDIVQDLFPASKSQS